MTETEPILTETDVGRDYESSLQDLKANSKPHINMLTMLADENQRYASKIAQIIENRIEKVATNQKLPLLYLIDSIVKNCPKSAYKDFFARNLANTFATVFKNSDEKVRQSLYKLRGTWVSVFPPSKLCALDIKVNEIDPKWPIRNDSTLKNSSNNNKSTSSVPLNPKVLNKSSSSIVVDVSSAKDEKQQKELLHRLQQQKLELELQKAQETLRLQQKQLEQTRIQTLKRTTPSPTIVPTPNPNGINRSALLGESPDKVEIDGGSCWIPMKKIKVEDTIEVGPSVSGLNERIPTPVPATPTATPGPTSLEKEKPVSLDSVPVNNRIYVDGRGYEVRFIDDVGVIERNGLPHRISFVGPPKDVVVDGKAISLNFTEVKEISIDGRPHTIKFGAPSRELYLGKNPLRGAFGGPAIFVNVGGSKHKIQLCGPPPEVKIDPEPSYELIRFMHSSHRTQGPVHDFGSQPHQQRFITQLAPLPLRTLPPSVQNQPPAFHTQAPPLAYPSLPPAFQPQLPPATFQTQPTINVEELLAKIGPIIGPLTKKPPTPPVASSVRFQADEIIEKRRQAPLNLKDFNSNSFKVRYSSLIDSLYQKTLQCSTCGLRFVDGDTQKYSRHLDWHFKQNRKDKTFKTNARSWFLAADDWINFEELGEDISTKNRSAIFERAQIRRNESDVLVASTDSAIVANNDNQNFCSVCGDKFEQFWDEEEEAWKLRNATSLNGKTYHPLCYADVENGEIEPNSNVTNVENSFMWSNIMAGGSNSRDLTSPKTVVKVEPLDDYVPVNSNIAVKNEPVDDY